MPSTAALLDDVKECEKKLGIEELVECSCTNVRYVAALNNAIIDKNQKNAADCPREKYQGIKK